jgi:hypothetical protein
MFTIYSTFKATNHYTIQTAVCNAINKTFIAAYESSFVFALLSAEQVSYHSAFYTPFSVAFFAAFGNAVESLQSTILHPLA